MRAATLRCVLALSLLPILATAQSAPPTTASVLAEAPASDWEPIDPANLLVMEVAGGQVLIELAPQFAPEHVGNIRQLAKQHYFDGLAIVRVQENYVVQWGDPEGETEQRRSLGEAKPKLPAEFSRGHGELPFLALPDPDSYAPRTGFSLGFPVARDERETWLVHCYAMVGAGRGGPADSSTGAELYTVIGHSPRHLDRNITLVGRVIEGLDRLTVLPRGGGAMGFYETPEQRVALRRVRLASDLPESERPRRERLRTESASFAKLVEARRFRREDWFVNPVGRVEVCNVPLPVRVAQP